MEPKSLLKFIAISLFANVMVAQISLANTSDLSNDFANYIASKGLDVNNSPVSDINNCALCHADVDSFATPHQFALDFMAAGKNEAAFSTIENLDSDGDGTSNGDEILQGFFPGISCDDLAGGNPISDWPADKNIADFVDPAKPGCIDAAADIDVQPAALNFTTAITGASKPLTAVIINLGTADLTVTALNFDATTSSDFALGADVPALPVVIAPNGLVHVEVVYAPSDVGSDSGALMVVSDSPNEEDFPVPLFGEGVAPPNDCDIVSGPASHDFGAVTVGETAMQTFNLQNQGTLTDCIVDAIMLGAAGSPDFSLAPVAVPLTLGPGESVPVDVSYTPGEAGDDVGTLDVVSNGVNSPASISLSGSGAGAPGPMVPDIAVSPLMIDFSVVMIGGSATDKATVSNNGDAPLTLSGVSLPAGSDFTYEVGLPVTIAPGASVDVLITFAPTSEGTISDTLSVSSNDPDESVVPVILAGVGQTPPPLECNLVVSPMALEFGKVQVDTTRTLDVSVSNTGTADCDVDAFLEGSSSPDFSIAASTILPMTLASGEKAVVSMDYFPAEAGDDAGLLTIQSNDPDSGSVMVGLTGSGFASSGGGTLEVREFEAFLFPGDGFLWSAGRAAGMAQIKFNEDGTEADIKISVRGREGKGRGGKGRGGKGPDDKEAGGASVMGAALYCGAPDGGQELISVYEDSGDGGMSMSYKWNFKGEVKEGDENINTATDCGTSLYEIALSTLSGSLSAVLHTGAGDFSGRFIPRGLGDSEDDLETEEGETFRPQGRKVSKR